MLYACGISSGGPPASITRRLIAVGPQCLRTHREVRNRAAVIAITALVKPATKITRENTSLNRTKKAKKLSKAPAITTADSMNDSVSSEARHR